MTKFLAFPARIKERIDIFLLLFLVFFTVDMVVLKPLTLFVALLFLIKTIKKQDIKNVPLFYMILPAIGLINLLLLHSDLSSERLVSFSIGVIYWLMALAAFVVVKLRVRDNSLKKAENTLTAFFILNVIVSIYQLVHVIYISGEINPYSSPDPNFGNSTGDYIKGTFFAPCYINMFVCCAFTVYYLYKSKYLLSFTAAVIAFLTTSNFAVAIFLPVLLILLVVLKPMKARLTIFLQLAFGVVFYLFISYGNLVYTVSSFSSRSIDKVETFALDTFKAKPETKKKKIASQDTLRKREKPQVSKKVSEEKNVKLGDKQYGKVISIKQTSDFLQSGVGDLLFGAGVGAFSSQLAVRTSDLPVSNGSRLFGYVPEYISDDFDENHYLVFTTIYKMGEEYHSIRHLPNSEINHILGEYGLLGLVSFFVFYVGFFLKRVKRTSYSILIGIMMGYFLMFDYVFEYLSLVLFFELFFLIDLKRDEERSIE